MGNNHSHSSTSTGGSSTLKRHIETATKTGVLQYDNKKLKEVRRKKKKIFFCSDYLLDKSWSLPSWFTYIIIE